jgi:hypothetical protein
MDFILYVRAFKISHIIVHLILIPLSNNNEHNSLYML